MTNSNRSPWLPNHVPSETEDQSRLTIRLWNYFSTAAAGVCRLYRGKVDQYADFQCLLDALAPMDQFFKGSQSSLEDALRYGKYTGARCVRLHLRDLLHTTSQPQPDQTDLQLFVPVDILVQELEGCRSHTRTCSRRHRCRHYKGVKSSCLKPGRLTRRCKRLRHISPQVQELIASDPVINHKMPVFPSISPYPVDLVFGGTRFETKDARLMEHSHSTAIGGSLSNSVQRYDFPNSTDTSSPVLTECLQSCETDRMRATVCRDSFDLFEDAVHMHNLLDPLSKFSVTSGPPEAVDHSAAPFSKRPRLRYSNCFDKSRIEPNPSSSN